VTDGDVQRIRASSGWRESRIEVMHGTSVGTVLVKGQRAARGPWRYRVLNGVARAAGLPMLRAAPAPGGAASQRIEVERLRALAAAGVLVPQVLHEDEQFFVMSFLDGPLLFIRLQAGDERAKAWWQWGVAALADVHARDPYSSQALTRNCIGVGERVAMFDEDDLPQVMPQARARARAQARDWLAHLNTSAMTPPAPADTLTARLRPALLAQSPAVQHELRTVSRLMGRWLPSRRHDGARGWRRYLGRLQCTQQVLTAALPDTASIAQPAKTDHARHH
jgi:tRNA A-37 threonylcarbamoyl transferase component Bud32